MSTGESTDSEGGAVLGDELESASQFPKWVLPAVTGTGVFLVYLRTLAPSIVGGDSGEFAAVACSSGVAHPPGYPLFTMLAKLFTFIPIGMVGWRINLFSALCDTLAAVLLLLSVRRLTKNQWAALLAAGLFAFSPLIWRFAVAAEVFPLNNLIIAAMIYFSVRFAQDGKAKDAYLFSLLFGLGLANHLTCLFYGVPLLIWILVQGRSVMWQRRSLFILAASFSLGTLPYVYLPIADLLTPPFSWGHTSTIEGFVTHLLRREYGTLQLAATGGRSYFLFGLAEYLKALPGQLFYVGLILAAVGLGAGYSTKISGLAITLVIAYFFYLFVFQALANLPIDQPGFLLIHSRFWQQAIVLTCFWAGLGFAAISSFLPKWRHRNGILALVSVAIVVSAAAYNFRSHDQHLNNSAADFAREFLRPLPPNAILWSDDDLVGFSLAYLQQCEGYRKDVVVLQRIWLRRAWMKRLVEVNYPRVKLPGPVYATNDGGYSSKELFDANSGNAAQFANHLDHDQLLDWSWRSSYQLWPYGMGSWIKGRYDQTDIKSYVEESSAALPQLNVASLSKYPAGTWENEILKYYWEARLDRSTHLIEYALSHNNDRLSLEAGAQGLEEILTRLHLGDDRLFKLLTVAYVRLAEYDGKYENNVKSTWQRYLELNPSADDSELNELRRQ